MNARKILFPTDFSTASQAAMTYATALARDAGATLLIVHIEELTPIVMEDGMYLPPPTVANPELNRMLAAVQPTDPQVRCEHLLVLGTPAADIVRIAEEQSVDLIVMGTHGRTGFSRLVMGSVAEAIVRRAPCPVLTVKEKHDTAVASE